MRTRATRTRRSLPPTTATEVDSTSKRIENGMALQKAVNTADKAMASTGTDAMTIALVSMTLLMGAAGIEIVRRGRHGI